jgi:hypothetical protein
VTSYLSLLCRIGRKIQISTNTRSRDMSYFFVVAAVFSVIVYAVVSAVVSVAAVVSVSVSVAVAVAVSVSVSVSFSVAIVVFAVVFVPNTFHHSSRTSRTNRLVVVFWTMKHRFMVIS